MYLTYRYRVYPTRAQHDAFGCILNEQVVLYNAALQERLDCYRQTGVTLTWVDQFKSLTACRRDPDLARCPVHIQRSTILRLDKAFERFFRRVKQTGRATYPRPLEAMNSFSFAEWCGVRLAPNGLKIKGIQGTIRVGFHRPLPNRKPVGCCFKREGKRWYVSIGMEVQEAEPRASRAQVGVDVGITCLAALSTGELIPNLRAHQSAHPKIRLVQRRVARRAKGANGRRKAVSELRAVRRKIKRRRSTYLHQVTKRLVADFDLIAIEDLNFCALQNTYLGKWVRDAGLGRLAYLLRYKSTLHGATLVEVDPRGTSMTCPSCGRVAKKLLKQRTHECPCGCAMDRDVAAANVVLKRAVAGPWPANVARWGARRAGNADDKSACHQHVGNNATTVTIAQQR
jgi:putative transposase